MTASIDLSSYRDQHFKVSITLYVLIYMHIFNTYFHFKRVHVRNRNAPCEIQPRFTWVISLFIQPRSKYMSSSAAVAMYALL